jgi:hypothetical protein
MYLIVTLSINDSWHKVLMYVFVFLGWLAYVFNCDTQHKPQAAQYAKVTYFLLLGWVWVFGRPFDTLICKLCCHSFEWRKIFASKNFWWNQEGHTNTCHHLIKVACFVSKVNNVGIINSSWSKLVCSRGQLYLAC